MRGLSLTKIGGALAASGMMLVSTAAFAAKAPHRAAGYPKLHWKGTITMFAQSYTPVAPGVKLAKGSIRLTELETLAKQFKHMYPGIHIKFVNPSFQDTNQEVETRAAGGTMYDVYFNQYENWNTVFPQGIVYNLAPYFKKPDPYIPGNKHWASVMNPRIVSETRAPGGQIYDVDGDYVGIEFFYNKNLFKKAGIVSPPKTWAALLADAKKLKAHGIIAGADVPTYDWWVRIFLGNYLGLPTLRKIASFSRQPGISEYDDAVAYERGILNPTKNPRIMAWWPVVKGLYKYWDKNTTVIPWNAEPTGAQTGETLFAAGKVAMVFQGTWTPNTVKAAGGKFAVGSFPMPSLVGTSKYATHYNSAGDAGGPQAAFQYAISTPKADNSMSQPGKFQAVLDWLRFISTPQHDQAIVNQLGSFVPTFKGTHPIPALASLESQLQRPWYQCDGGQFWTSAEYTTIRNIFQEYLGGHLTLKQATQQYTQTVATAYHTFALEHHLTP